MFGLMLVSTHDAKLKEMAVAEAKHQRTMDDTISTLRTSLATADSSKNKLVNELAEAKTALATCRNHAETLTAKITADEPLVAAGRAAKRRETAKNTVSTSTTKKPAAKKAVAA